MSAADIEPVRAMVACEFFDAANTKTRYVDDVRDKTIGSIRGRDVPGEDDLPTVFTGASLAHFGDCWRLVVLRTITHDTSLHRTAVRYFLESDGETVFEAKSQARVMRGTRDVTIGDESIEEDVGYSRLEYEKPLDKVSCMRLQRQLGQIIARRETLADRNRG